MFVPLIGQAAMTSDLVISMMGVAAAVLTTASFLPQILRAYWTRSMGDVSIYLMTMFATGTVLWMVYGIFKADLVIIGANAVSTALNLVLLYMKFAYKHKSTKIA